MLDVCSSSNRIPPNVIAVALLTPDLFTPLSCSSAAREQSYCHSRMLRLVWLCLAGQPELDQEKPTVPIGLMSMLQNWPSAEAELSNIRFSMRPVSSISCCNSILTLSAVL